MRYLPYIILACIVAFLMRILVIAEGTYDYGDGLTHYFISRYSFSHPHLLLDHWGKPFFTLLSSPFSQLGLKGIMLFNILCGLAAGFFCWKIADRLGMKNSFLAIPFTCLSPIYINVMMSGLTEPLFSMMLPAAIYLLLLGKYRWAAVILSFLPFVRAEYLFVAPVLLLFFISKKQFVSILFLGTGFVIYSLAGSFYHGDLLWVINKDPYHMGPDLYNVSPDIFAYIGNYEMITGLVLGIFIVLGMIWFLGTSFFMLIKKRIQENPSFQAEVLLIYGCALSVFAGHSLLWGLGFFQTLGMPRYMATIIPLLALIGLRGFNMLTISFVRFRLLTWVLIAAAGAGIIYDSVKVNDMKFSLLAEERVIHEVSKWLKEKDLDERKFYYMSPFFSAEMDIDPSDRERHGEYGDLEANRPSGKMKTGEILFWDGHYGANEGHMVLDSLKADSGLRYLRSFQPEWPFDIMGRKYEIWLFERE